MGSIGKRHGPDLRRERGDQNPVFMPQRSLDCGHPEARSEQTIVGSGGSAALHMTEHGHPVLVIR